MEKIFLTLTGICLLFLFYCCTSTRSAVSSTLQEIPKVEREFRAVWIATVANINWPSKPGLSTEEQQQEALHLINFLHEHHFNAVILQVRPQCDALYQSEMEPWSYYLTGAQGKPPDPYYDPLEFWIEETHKRGMEIHAWLNPYRAHHPSGKEVTDASIVRKSPDLVVELRNGYWWMDPGKKGTQEHATEVVLDIVRRYDVDGIHFDDYFYPYPSYNDNEDFPDQESWEAYKSSGGKLGRADWRRENVNQFIRKLYGKIKKEKRHVQFGLSPFGIWRPNHPESTTGFDQYEQLYADARLWLNKGWIDYFTPQLYWPVNQIPQSFPVLLGWWLEENKKHRHVWPGINIGRFEGEQGADETINQIMITRGMANKDPGHVLWSIGPLLREDSLATSIQEGPYKKPAIAPASPWLDKKRPGIPQISVHAVRDTLQLSWSHENPADIFQWIIYTKYGGSWNYQIKNSQSNLLSLPLFMLSANDQMARLNSIQVTAVDRAGNESVPIVVGVP